MSITPRLVTTSALTAGLALTLSLAACGSDPVQTSAAPQAAPPAAGPARAIDVPILGKVSGDQLAGDDYGLKLMNVDQLVGTGLGQAFASAGIDLDSERHSVVLLALGEQPSTGYAVDITALQHKGRTLFVQGSATPPADDAATNPLSTRPFTAVAVARVPVGTVVRSDIK